MDRPELERRGVDRPDFSRDAWVALADQAPPPVRDDLVLDLRDEGTVIDLRGLDAPEMRGAVQLPVTPLADPNRVTLVGSRWVLLVSLALLNVLDLITTKAVLAAGGTEGNPIMASIIHDPIAPVLVKTAGVGLVALVVNSCPADSRLVNRALSLAVVTYAFIVSWNLVNLLVA